MKYLAITAVIASLAATPAMAQQAQLSPADITKIKGEVEAALAHYVKLFSAQDAKGIGATVFTNPSIALGPSGPKMQTPDDVVANYTKTFDDLKKIGYDHSVFSNVQVCVTSANNAIVGGTFKRIKKDGSQIMEARASYLYTRTPDGWRLVSGLGSPKTGVTCD